MKEKDLDDLTALWQQAKSGAQQPSLDVAAISKAGEARKKSTLAAHYGNAAVLSATVIMLVFYFYYLYHFQDLLSKVGYNLMIGGLIIRIVIEIFSALRSNQIKISDITTASLHNSVAFLEFRKRIHGPVTIFIFVLYFIGFYMLTPEFSRYISLKWLLIMDISALFIAVMLMYFIRRGIKQEMEHLENMITIHKSLVKED
jgi:hypothetical protein